MKRFHLFRLVFALVCGCHINGVKSKSCNDTEYLDENYKCQSCGCNTVGLKGSGPNCDVFGTCFCDNANGYFGTKCETCGIRFYKVQKKCKACNCHVNGAKNVGCDGSGQCTCHSESYTGLRCDICVSGKHWINEHCCSSGYYYSSVYKVCIACNCHPRGAQDSQCDGTGQCTCYPGNAGKLCDRCLKGKVLTNGRCCPPGYHYSHSLGGCQSCSCNPNGIHQQPCNNGKCPCKYLYKGAGCYDIEGKEIRIGKLLVGAFDIRYKALVIHCHGNCVIKSLKVEPSSEKVQMYGSTGAFYNTWWGPTGTHGTLFCKHFPTAFQKCNTYKGTLNADKVYILFAKYSKDFSNAKFKFEIGNFEKSEEQSF